MILLEKLNREHTFKIMLITPAINLTGVLYLYNMKLIEYINYEIKVSDEALLVKPIRDLYRADKSKTKETFYTQCSIIFFMADPRSSYAYIVDENERFDLIKKQEGLTNKKLLHYLFYQKQFHHNYLKIRILLLIKYVNFYEM